MKLYGVLVVLLNLSLSFFPWPNCHADESLDSTWVLVRKAVDGDTLLLEDGRLVRLIGIDSPEIDHEKGLMQPMADQAWSFLEQAINGKKVRLVLGKEAKDRYGRVLAYVYDQNGRLLNQSIVAQGYAYVLYVMPNVDKHEQLLISQRQAMAAEKGIWKTLKSKKTPFIGNKHTKRFHSNQCPSGRRIKKANRVFFSSNQDAFYAGYAPCKRCLPVATNKRLQRN